MKLGKYLKVCKYRNVSIGAKNGSAYMYIGDKTATITMTDIFEEYMVRMKHRYPMLIGQYKTYLNEHDCDLNTEAGLLAYGKKVASLWTSCDKCKNYIDTYKPILEREIVDHYVKETDQDCEIIIVEGYEKGQFWTYEEYLNSRIKYYDIPVKKDILDLIAEAEKDGRTYVRDIDFFNRIYAKNFNIPEKTRCVGGYNIEKLKKEYGLEAADVISR